MNRGAYKKKIISGHQVNYLPYPGYFKKILMSDLFLVVSNVQFNKKSWQNRNRIMNQGLPAWLTVPVITKNRFNQLLKDTKINNDIPWQKKHYKSILFNYQKSLFFSELEEFLYDIYLSTQWDYLVDLNLSILKYFLQKLEINIPIYHDIDYNISGHKTELLTSICDAFNCDGYLSSPNSKSYIEVEKFHQANKSHFYMRFDCPVYPQKSKEFIPNLSIIDMIFNCGFKKARQIISTNQELFLDI